MGVTDADASVGLIRTYAEDRLLEEEEREAFLAEVRRQVLTLDGTLHASLQQRHAAQVRAEVAAVIRRELEEVDLVFGPGPLGISVCEDDSGTVKVAKLLTASDGSPGQAARLGGVAPGSIITHVDGEFVGDQGREAVKALIAQRPRPIAVRFLSDVRRPATSHQLPARRCAHPTRHAPASQPCTPASSPRGDRSYSNLSTDSLGDSSYPQQPAKGEECTAIPPAPWHLAVPRTHTCLHASPSQVVVAILVGGLLRRQRPTQADRGERCVCQGQQPGRGRAGRRRCKAWCRHHAAAQHY